MTSDSNATEGPKAPADTTAPSAGAAEGQGAIAADASAGSSPDATPEPAHDDAPAPSGGTPAPKPDLSPEATGARLAALFPALFVGPDGRGEWKAIKLRIHADIQARAPGEFSKRALGIFFARYTTTTPYLKALAAPGAQRHDLDGQPAGEIADEHRNAAAEELARRQAIAAEKREAFRKAAAAQREAARPRPADGDALPSPRPARAPRAERPVDQPVGAGKPRDRRGPPGHGDRRERLQRPQRPEQPRAPRGGQRAQEPPRREPQPDAGAALPVDPAQRERAMLLRAFESSPLSKANFCALKRLSEAELDAQLAQARAERGPR